MPLESLRCPQCGAPVQADTSAGSTFCSYCGSRVEVARGPSGVGAPVDADTRILAKATALRQLEERLQALLAERQRLARQIDREVATSVQAALPEDASGRPSGRMLRPTAWALFVVAILMTVQSACCVSIASSEPRYGEQASRRETALICLIPTIAAWGGTVWLWRRADAHAGMIGWLESEARHKARAAYRGRQSGLDAEIQSTRGRIEELKAELADLARGR